MKTEIWNNYPIRFVEKDGEWWAVGIDVARALGYASPRAAISKHCKGVSNLDTPSGVGNQETIIISEIDIYNLVFKAADQSRSKIVKETAEEFKQWVFDVIKTLRQSSGLEGFQVFRILHKSLKQPARIDFIKANTIAYKATSIRFGHPKMIKKADISPEMLIDRQTLLDDAVELMTIKEKYHLEFSVSEHIYSLANKMERPVS